MGSDRRDPQWLYHLGSDMEQDEANDIEKSQLEAIHGIE